MTLKSIKGFKSHASMSKILADVSRKNQGLVQTKQALNHSPILSQLCALGQVFSASNFSILICEMG